MTIFVRMSNIGQTCTILWHRGAILNIYVNRFTPAHNTMQVPTLMLVVAIEIYSALLIATFALLFFCFKQKKLIKRQQDKLKELLAAVKSIQIVAKGYKQYLHEQLAATRDRLNALTPHNVIAGIQLAHAPGIQGIFVLRHTFLRAEELATSAVPGSEGYWNIFKQALEPLLSPHTKAPPGEAGNDELETYKKRVGNLEKFKKLFFDLEKRWNEAQANAQGYYDELHSMANGIADRERYELILGRYSDSYKDINHYIYSVSDAVNGVPQDNKTINIIRHDPRAAEEILKLRNVAADQYRVISNLQRKLEEAVSAEEKDLVIRELEQQLQRQIRFVQESDTCVQLLEDELNKANEKIAAQELQLDKEHHLEEENQHIKQTLQEFTRESKNLLVNIENLEKENDELKHNLDGTDPAIGNTRHNIAEIQTEFAELRKQYAELEEKYLELKFK